MIVSLAANSEGSTEWSAGEKSTLRSSPGRRDRELSENTPRMPGASSQTKNAGLSVRSVTRKPETSTATAASGTGLSLNGAKK